MQRDVHASLVAALAAISLIAFPGAASAGPLGNFGLTAIAGGDAGIDPYNPLIAGTLTVLPSYKLTQNLSVGGRIDVTRELTNDDDNSEKHETLWFDPYVGVVHGALARIGDIATLGGLARVYVPVSEASRLGGLNAAARLGGTVTVGLPRGSTFLFTPLVQKNFHDATVAQLQRCGDRRNCVTGMQLTSWAAMWVFDLEVPLFGGVSFVANWTLNDGHAYDTNTTTLAELGVLGAPRGATVEPRPGYDNKHERFVQAASLGLQWALGDGLTLATSMDNGWMPRLRPNGQDYYNPLLAYQNYGNFTLVGVDLTYVL